MNEHEEQLERLSNTDPSMEEIAVHESGCPCGTAACEYAADFFGSDARAVKDPIDADGEENAAEFSEELEGYDDYMIPAAPSFGPGIPVEFPVPDAFRIGKDGSEEESFDPEQDNGEALYTNTSDYTMIGNAADIVDAQGS